jgi:outer membrane protein OmpA-like peptidoglycan-associated protein
MNLEKGFAILLLFLFVPLMFMGQDFVFDTAGFYSPDIVSSSKFKHGYTKGNPQIPPKYRDISEEKTFYGGREYSFIENFDLEKLLVVNQEYVYLPTGSYIVFKFEKGLKDHENSPDLIIQSCTICGCRQDEVVDSARISVSNNNIMFKELVVIKNPETVMLDFNDFNLDNVRFVKVEGLSAMQHPYGYGLMNIYGFAGTPKKIYEVKAPVKDTNTIEKEIITVKDMLFEFNDSTIRNTELGYLDSICRVLTGQVFDHLIISGYTDSVGSEGYNLKLSLARAGTIANYLVGCGINKEKLKTFGYGETRLLKNVEGDDPGNRRVEIEIVRKE